MSYSDSTTLKLNYNDDTLLGKLSNLLDKKGKTLKLIILSIELIEAFQSLRPKLIELSLENHDEEFEDWH